MPEIRFFHVRIWGNSGPEFEEIDEKEVIRLVRSGQDIYVHSTWNPEWSKVEINATEVPASIEKKWLKEQLAKHDHAKALAADLEKL